MNKPGVRKEVDVKKFRAIKIVIISQQDLKTASKVSTCQSPGLVPTCEASKRKLHIFGQIGINNFSCISIFTI